MTPGLLLLNLGTPDEPTTPAVRRYLREFLSDPRVLDVPAWQRWLILNLFILPFRPRASAAAYRKIWTDRGSPLLVHGRDLAAKLRAVFGDRLRVELAMRYGTPSIDAAVRRLVDEGVNRIVVLPLFPEYSSAATGSAVEKVFDVVSELWNVPALQGVPPFHDHPAFLDAWARRARPVLDEVRPERVFLSFHGLPERQIRKSDPTGRHCLVRSDCCDRAVPENAFCYRAHCFAEARRLGSLLDLDPERTTVCFQSRLGRDPWLRPFTDEVVRESAGQGVRRAVVLSPGFVADCLETLEEIGIRAAEDFRKHGGERLELVPSLNATDEWVDALVRILREGSSWIPEPGRS